VGRYNVGYEGFENRGRVSTGIYVSLDISTNIG